MDLTSPLFLFFFLPVFLLVYLVSVQPLRTWLILAGSLIFILWGQASALWWLVGLLSGAYGLGRLIAWAQAGKRGSHRWMWLGIGVSLLLLCAFKFIVAYGESGLLQIGLPEPWAGPVGKLAVPIGLSYVTFQVISYLVDVQRSRIPAEQNFWDLAVYLLFFPKLVSGPLVRYQAFKEELARLSPTTDDIAQGMRRLLAGFIKRTLIANQVGLMADAVFNLPDPNLAPHFAWLGLLAYAIQIYFDFAGYTDMAIGLGLMLGIRLPENFNYPYIAQSLSDFWRRWHMSLTAWFREYVFFPLERRRLKWAGQQLNIVIVFLLTGLWHGFKPTFIAWGLLSGLVLALESTAFGRFLSKLWRPLRHVYTLLIILIGWVLFRSDNLAFAWGFLGRLTGDASGLTPLPFSLTTPLPFIEPTFVLLLVTGVVFCMPVVRLWNRLREKTEGKNALSFFVFQAAEDLVLVALFILGLAATLSSHFSPNIYAHF